jgi:hypothetical protein
MIASAWRVSQHNCPNAVERSMASRQTLAEDVRGTLGLRALETTEASNQTRAAAALIGLR